MTGPVDPDVHGQRMSESDRRLNVTSRLLAVVSNFGGERIVADNPAMPELVDQLADECEQLFREGFLGHDRST